MGSGPCHCDQDEDGHCSNCKEAMASGIREFGLVFKEFQDKVDSLKGIFGREKCDECGKRYADWAMSLVFEEFGKADTPKESVDGTFKAMIRIFMGVGISSFPLSLKTYKEICWRNGWNESHIFD